MACSIKLDTDNSTQFKIRNVVTTADLMQPVDIARLNDYPWGRFDIINNYNGKVGYVKDSSLELKKTTSGLTLKNQH